MVKTVSYKMNINNLEKATGDLTVFMNDIAHVVIKTSSPLIFDPYLNNNTTGSIILIDEGTNETVAAGMIIGD